MGLLRTIIFWLDGIFPGTRDVSSEEAVVASGECGNRVINIQECLTHVNYKPRPHKVENKYFYQLFIITIICESKGLILT